MTENIAYTIKENSFLAKLAAWKLGKSTMAIVFGSRIHLFNCSEEAFLSNQSWLRHELCHVKQYQQHGYLLFLFKYLWESIRHGYYNNRFEVEARAAESENG